MIVMVVTSIEELHLEVPSGHELAGRETVTIQEIAALPMVALRAGYGLRHVVDRLFYEAGQNARITIEVTELSTLRALVQQGNGVVGIVPTSHDEHNSPSTTVPLSDANACRHYGAVTRLYGPSGSAARAFLQFIIDMSPPRTDGDAAEVPV